MHIETDEFQKWLESYSRAWENRDPQAAADLFTADAAYHETPFDPPMQGRQAIFDYWADVPKLQKDIRFNFGILAVNQATGIAHWQASFTRINTGVHVELDGILTATFDESLRCKTFREWWHRIES